MDLVFAIAVTTHMGLEKNYNEVHPHIRLDQDRGMVAGAYYNSEENLSLYAGYNYTFDNDIFVEGGLVSGYNFSDSPVIPYVRAGYNFNDNVSAFVAPVGEVDAFDNITIGAVAGLEYKF